MSKNKNNTYIVYKAENLENGEVYIGVTSKSIEDRKQDHLQKMEKEDANKFHQAICTYGVEAFKWEQVDTANSIDELAQKEKAYIFEYNAKQEGYNTDSGGGFKKTVYQYNIDNGSLAGSYNSLEEAGKVVGTTKQHISRACLSVNKTYNGFYWSYEYKVPFVPEKDVRKKKVIYYNFKDETIEEFQSVAEASRATGVSKSCIARFCRGERKPPLDYEWEYA